MTRILIVGDIRLYRDGLAEILGRRFDVVGTAAGADETLARADALAPDVVLLDLAMASALDTIRALVAAGSPPRVVALAVPDAEREVIDCAEAGVAGLATREGSIADVTATIESGAGGRGGGSRSRMPGGSTRIVLVNLPRMLREIIEDVVAAAPDLDVVETLDKPTGLIAVVDGAKADFLIAGDDALEDVGVLLRERPRLKVLAVACDGRQTFLYELGPQKVALDEVSPQNLLEATPP